MVQIKHNNSAKPYTRCTFAIEVPSKEMLVEAVELGFDGLECNLGVAFVHPKDQYNKKIGRELALSKLKNQEFELTNITMRETRVVFNYITTVTNRDKLVDIEVGFSYIHNHTKSRLEYIVLREGY